MDNENGVKPTEVAEQPPAEKIDKIIARRLSESREQLAVALGFDSWDSAMNSGYDKKLLDAGIDPKVGTPKFKRRNKFLQKLKNSALQPKSLH